MKSADVDVYMLHSSEHLSRLRARCEGKWFEKQFVKDPTTQFISKIHRNRESIRSCLEYMN